MVYRYIALQGPLNFSKLKTSNLHSKSQSQMRNSTQHIKQTHDQGPTHSSQQKIQASLHVSWIPALVEFRRATGEGICGAQWECEEVLLGPCVVLCTSRNLGLL